MSQGKALVCWFKSETESPQEGSAMVGSRLFQRLALGPGAALLRSKSHTARDTLTRLASIPFALRKHFDGEATAAPVEVRMQGYQKYMAQLRTQMDGFHKEYLQRMKAEGQTPMVFDDFDKEVGQAMRAGQVHAVPEVVKGAEMARGVMDEVLRKAQEVGVVSAKEVEEFGPGWFPRTYDMTKLGSEYEMEDRIVQYWVAEFRQGGAIKKKWKGRTLEGKSVNDENVEEYARSVARAGIRHLTIGRTTGPRGMANGQLSKARALRDDVLDVPDDIISDFLDHRASWSLRWHVQDLSADIEMHRVFGDRSIEPELEKISDEYSDLRRSIQDNTGMPESRQKAEITKLNREERQVRIQLQAMVDRLQGTAGAPADPASGLVKAGRMLRGWTASAYLGAATISSLPDVARGVMQWGLRPYGRPLQKLALDANARAQGVSQLRELGIGLDMALDVRANAVLDLDRIGADPIQMAAEKIQRKVPGMQWVPAHKMTIGRMTLLSPWATGMKTAHGAVVGNRIAQEVVKYAQKGKAGMPSTTVAKLARVGIGEKEAKQIAPFLEEFGDDGGDLLLPMTNHWWQKHGREGSDAADILENAIRSETNFVTLEPGIADKWLWTDTEVGKLIFQFQTFLLTAHNRMLVAGVQRADRDFVMGVLAMAGMGAIVVGIKDWVRDRDTFDRPVAAIIADSIDRAGLAGMGSMILNHATKYATSDVPSRYLGRGAWQQILGPSLGGMVPAALEEAFALAQGEVDGPGIVRLFPYTNVLHMSDAFEKATGMEIR